MPQLNSFGVSTPGFRGALALMAVLGLAGCAQQMQQMKQPGFYDPPAASSLTDAQDRADASYAQQTLRAPSQIQFDLRRPVAPTQSGDQQAAVPAAAPVPASATPAKVAVGTGQAAAQPYDAASAPNDAPPGDAGASSGTASAAAPAETPQASLIPEPQTFSGTLPCFHPAMKCTAQRITLTLAPNGRWRARAAYLDQTVQSGAKQLDQGCWRAIFTAEPRITLLTSQGNARAELIVTSSGNALRLSSINGQVPNLVYNLARQPDLDPIDELNGKPSPTCS